MEHERDFKGVWIPKEIWSNTELTLIEKIILVEIDSLDVNEEGCYASNKYLADFCNCTETTISTSINKLIKMEYLYLVKFDGRRRYLKSAIKTFKVSIQNIEKQTLNNLKADFKKLKAININNNIDNNIKENNIKERFKKPTLEDIEEYCKSRNNNIDPKKFYDYYSVNNWKDKDGKQVKSWKQKVITWEGRSRSNNVPEWFDQNLDIEKASKEEVNEMKNILNI